MPSPQSMEIVATTEPLLPLPGPRVYIDEDGQEVRDTVNPLGVFFKFFATTEVTCIWTHEKDEVPEATSIESLSQVAELPPGLCHVSSEVKSGDYVDPLTVSGDLETRFADIKKGEPCSDGSFPHKIQMVGVDSIKAVPEIAVNESLNGNSFVATQNYDINIDKMSGESIFTVEEKNREFDGCLDIIGIDSAVPVQQQLESAGGPEVGQGLSNGSEPNKLENIDPSLANVKLDSNGEKVEPVGNSGLVCVQVPRSWANVVRGPENVTCTPMRQPGVEDSKRSPKMMKLSLKETIVKEDGCITSKIPKKVADKGFEIWKHTLVGYFYDKPPPHRIIRVCANNLWARFGFHKMTPYENGLFLFQFKDEKGMELVMERGPWLIHRYPLFLKKWSPNEDCLKESFKTIPVWVNFFGIPLKYWSEEGLSHVASTIGVPIHADHITAERDRIDFARICVDFNVESKFPNSVFIEEEDGPGFLVRLEYSWTPKVCDKCRLFGHRTTSCTNVVEKVWVPIEESVQERRDERKVEGSRGIKNPARPHSMITLGSRSSKKEDRSLGNEVEHMASIGRQAQQPMFSESGGVHQSPARRTVTPPPPPLVGNGGAKEEAPFISPSDCLRPRFTSGARKTRVEVSNPFEHLLEVDDDVNDDDYDDMSPRTSGLANLMDSREKNKKKLKCLRNVF